MPYKPMQCEWRRVDRRTKALHMVGRTILNLQPSVSDAEVKALRESIGFTNDHLWSVTSKSQHLDLLATEILQRDRASAVRETDWSTAKGDGCLSGWMAERRSTREIPVPSIEYVERIAEVDRSPLRIVKRYWYTGDRTPERPIPVQRTTKPKRGSLADVWHSL
jgi:hypothetical protein